MYWQAATFLTSLLGIIAATSLINKPQAPPEVTNMYAPPPVNPFKEAVAATGLIEAYKENIFIGVPVEGIVQEVFVKAGDHIKAGDPLLQLDDRRQQAQVILEEQNVALAKATLEKTRSQLSRLQAVGDSRAVSVEDLRNKEYDVLVAERTLAQSEAQLHQALVSLELTRISCPQDGVVLRNDLRKGEFVNFVPVDGTDKTNHPLVIGKIHNMQIRADIDEQNAYRIKANHEAIAYTRGTRQKPIKLQFERIEPYCIPKRNLSSVSNERIDTRVLQVIYTFEPNGDYPLYVGQQVDIFINAPLGAP